MEHAPIASEYFNEGNTYPTVAVACGLLATAAFAQTTRTPPTPQSAPARTGATQPPPSAQDFVNKIAISDMFEIQSSQLALSKEPDSDTKPFAQRIVVDHQKNIA
jgi:putative membrane protein